MLPSLTRSHVSPPSSESSSTPSSASTMAHTRPDLAGDAATPMRPLIPSGIPGRSVRSVPSIAAVGRPPQAALGPCADQAPGRPQHLPYRGVQDSRVVGVHGQVDRACPLAPEQDALPRAASVRGAEDPPLRVRAEGVSQRRDVDPVGVARVYAHPGDVPRVVKADVLPRGPGVGGPVDAVAVGDVAADARLAGAGVHDRWVCVGDSDRADGGGAEEAVGHVAPVRSAVGGLPDAARAGPEVEGLPLLRVARHCHDAPPSVWPDRPPSQRPKMLGAQSDAQRGLLAIPWGIAVRAAPACYHELKSQAQAPFAALPTVEITTQAG